MRPPCVPEGHAAAGQIAKEFIPSRAWRTWTAAGPAALSLALAIIATPASAQAPEIGGLLPSGGPRAVITHVLIDGKNLKGAKLFVGGKGITVRATQVAADGSQVAADVLVEPGAPLGPHDVRIATPQGVSNGARFFVDVLPNRVLPQTMAESAPPEPIDGASPVVINSRISARPGRDRFTLVAKAGEVWTFQCLADGIRSRMDPVLELKDEAGVSLRLVEGAWESDPGFCCRFAKAGRYFLTVRDSEYNGGPNYTYRLLAARTPFVSGFSPRGGRPGQTVDVTLQGVNLPTERASVAIPRDASGVYWANVLAGSSGSILLPMLVSAEPVVDAGDQETVRPLPVLPAAVDGTFAHLPQATFAFHAAAGDKFDFDLLGRRIGSRIDGALRVLDSAGKEVAAIDDAPGLGKDARLEFAAPAAGEYRLEARNVEEIIGPDCYYRLRAALVVPDFEVAITTDRLTVPVAGTVVVPISLERIGGFSGPVTVRCDGLPAGVTLRGSTFAPGAKSVEATLTAAPDAAIASAPVRLIAEANIGGRTVAHEAPAWERYEHRSIDLLLSVEYSYTRPHHIWDLLLLGVTDRTDSVTISSLLSELTLARGQRAEIPVHILRHPGTMGEIKLDVRGLPAKVAAAAVAIPANQSDGKLVLTAAPDAAPYVGGIIVQAHLGAAITLLPSVQLTIAKR